MTRVMLIADDMTGALDAGACLLPADVLVATSPEGAGRLLAEVRPAVLCVNAETRHLDASSAAGRVASLVECARREGVRCVVKKTDSALRGNVGAELAAAWRASGCERLHFIPALPEMGRVTRGGVHYVEGMPVSEGRFGRDPFEPVACSDVSELIGLQTDAPVTTVPEGEPVPDGVRGIVVYDATSPDRMLARVRELEEGGELGVMAGCAGVMRALARVLDLSPRQEGGVTNAGNLLVVCGSVNGTSRGQCSYAASCGAAVLPIAEREKCDDSWLGSGSGRDFVSRAARSWATAPLTVVDGSGLEDLTRFLPDGVEVRQVVADHIGALLVRICESGAGGRVLVTGGDILASFLAQVHADRLRPLGQPAPGIVCFELEVAGRTIAVASKSGGFGSRSLFVDMAGLPKEKQRSVPMLSKYSLRLPKVVYGGENPTDELAAALRREGAKSVVVFTDAALHKLGLVNPVLEAIESVGATFEIIDDIPAEPTYGQVQNVVDQVKSASADAIVAVGGGSVMDAAKLAAVCATDAYTVHDLLADPTRATKQLTTFMVPTTAGTGAEATPNAIVAVPEDELKVGIVNDAMIADYVVLDARMIKNLPRPIAASTGIDALCHAIECYTSTKANPFSDVFALEAFDLIINNIEAACDDPEAMDAKRAMQIASFYAGIAITASGTTAVHALSYPLGGKYHVAHGVSNAILLSPVMHFNEPAIRERLAVAYDRAIRGDATTVEEKSAAVIERMDAIVSHLDIPKKLDELGVTGVDVDQLAAAGMTVQRLLVNNMREVTLEDAKVIYAQVL